MPLALLALTLSAFAIGTTEFVIVGLIPTIAGDLGVDLPSAGLLVSLYALSVAIGAPLLTALTGRVPRKLLLVGLMALFTAGNLVAWQAPSYEALIVARILTGLAHGVFFSVGSIIATSLVPKEKAASAIASMFSGMTVAFVTGIPLGTFIGQHFGWRTTFLVVSAFGLVALLGSLLFVPRNIRHTPPAPLLRQARVLLQPRLLLVYAMTAVGYGGSLIAFTYLAPILQDLAGFSPNMVGVVLLAYGVSVAVGNIWGGRLADARGPVKALETIFLALAAASPPATRGCWCSPCWPGVRWPSATCPGCRYTWSGRPSGSPRKRWTWPLASTSPPSTSASPAAPGPAAWWWPTSAWPIRRGSPPWWCSPPSA